MRYQNLTFTAAGKVGIIEDEVAPLTAGQVLVRTKLSLTSPGTELAYFEGKHTSLQTLAAGEPRCNPGYSSTGVVQAIGPGVTNIKPGERVACTGGHISWACPDARDVIPIPPDVTDEQAIFFMLGSIALHGARTAAPQFGENVLVMGLGAIGQIVVQLMRLTPAREIIAADLYRFRREFAAKSGAICTLDPLDPGFASAIGTHTAGRGCEVVIDASGSPKAIPTELRAAAKRGRVIVLGSPHGEAVLDLYTDLHKKEVSLVGCYQPLCPEIENSVGQWTQQRNRALILDYVRAKRLDLASLITHRASFRQAQAVYDALSREKDRSLAGVFDWSDA